MSEWLTFAFQAAIIALGAWQLGSAVKDLGWRSVRETGGHWLIAVGCVGVAILVGTVHYSSLLVTRGWLGAGLFGGIGLILGGFVGCAWRLRYSRKGRFVLGYEDLLLKTRLDEDSEASLYDLSAGELATFRVQLHEVRLLWQQATDGDEEFHVGEIDMVERNLERIDAEIARRQLPAMTPLDRLSPSTQPTPS